MMNAASMPMYDMPEVRRALDDLWCGLSHGMRREGLANVPDRLLHGVDVNVLWGDPMLFFSQCCGYDLVNRYAGKLQPLATPHFGADGCEGASYASVVVVAEDVPATDVLHMCGAVCVINGTESHSGMNALRALIAPASRDGRFFSNVRVSGSHAASLEILRNREADVACVDCVTYALLECYRPEALSGTRMLGWTDRAPAPPDATALGRRHRGAHALRTARRIRRPGFPYHEAGLVPEGPGGVARAGLRRDRRTPGGCRTRGLSGSAIASVHRARRGVSCSGCELTRGYRALVHATSGAGADTLVPIGTLRRMGVY